MRGKKTDKSKIYEIMTAWASSENYTETARMTGMPIGTVKNIVDENKNKPEFVKLQTEKAEEFSKAASKIIGKGLTLLNRRFDRALTHETDLDVLIDEIFDTPKSELTQDEKNRLTAKIKALQLQDVKAITTAIGTLYDKRALSDGNPTSSVQIMGDGVKIDKLAEIAGYERKQHGGN